MELIINLCYYVCLSVPVGAFTAAVISCSWRSIKSSQLHGTHCDSYPQWRLMFQQIHSWDCEFTYCHNFFVFI